MLTNAVLKAELEALIKRESLPAPFDIKVTRKEVTFTYEGLHYIASALYHHTTRAKLIYPDYDPTTNEVKTVMVDNHPSKSWTYVTIKRTSRTASEAAYAKLPRRPGLTPEPVSLPIIPERPPVRLDEVHPSVVKGTRFDKIMLRVLEHEGGYVNHPKDPGRATKWGVTIGTLANWRNVDVDTLTPADVKRMSMAEARRIYWELYWLPSQAGRMPAGLDYAVFDFAVNSGVSRAVKELQELIGTEADGIVGGLTLNALARKGNQYPELLHRYIDARLKFLQRIRHRKTKELLWDTFGGGWGKRVARVNSTARIMMGLTG